MTLKKLFGLTIAFLLTTSLYAQYVCDVAITEIMVDPTPQVGLPEAEYIEIYNRSNHSIDLTDWHLIVGTHELLFPKAKIEAHQYIILCDINNISLFEQYGATIGMLSWAPLVNSGSIIAITDKEKELVHVVKYSLQMYGANSNGGWSLEMIDTSTPYRGDDNWSVSTAPLGGTPASKNSIAANVTDNYFHGIVSAYIDENNNLNLFFDEAVFGLTTNNITINGTKPISVTLGDILQRIFVVEAAFDIIVDENYTLLLSDGVTDFAGNRANNNSITIALPQKAEQGDILFNELLFDPFEGEATFIEFYNSSNKAIDVSQLQLASVASTGKIGAFKPISDIPYIMLPKTYLAISSNKTSLIKRYPTIETAAILQVSSMPSISKKQGHLLLYNLNNNLIDELIYSDKMHYTLMATTTGISIEKSVPNGASDNSSLWHSASASAGYATPGTVNSVCIEPMETEPMVVELSSQRISPNGDGNDDFLKISIQNHSPNNVVSVTIYSETGRVVKQIVENAIVGSLSTFYWDGTDSHEIKVKNGIYIILINSFDKAGNVCQFKNVCIVAPN